MAIDGFGSWIRRARELRGLRQDTVAAEAAKLPELRDVELSGLTQSTIARLEGGASPKPETLRALSLVYRLPFETMIAAYTGFVFFGIDPEEALLTGGALNPRTPFFITNAGRVLDLGALADWERGIVDRSDDKANVSLWIVAPNFVDDSNNAFLEIVVDHLLARGACLTYFVSKQDIGPGGRFEVFLQRVVRRIRSHHPELLARDTLGDISVYVLSQDEQVWLTSDMVIANPDDIISGIDQPEGFTVVSLEGEPALAIPIPKREVTRIAALIRSKIEEKIISPDDSWQASALKGSRFFKRIKEQ